MITRGLSAAKCCAPLIGTLSISRAQLGGPMGCRPGDFCTTARGSRPPHSAIDDRGRPGTNLTRPLTALDDPSTSLDDHSRCSSSIHGRRHPSTPPPLRSRPEAPTGLCRRGQPQALAGARAPFWEAVGVSLAARGRRLEAIRGRLPYESQPTRRRCVMALGGIQARARPARAVHYRWPGTVCLAHNIPNCARRADPTDAIDIMP